MRTLFGSMTLAVLTVAIPATAHAQNRSGQVQGFGGLTLNGLNPSTTVGGSVGFKLSDNIQIVAEGGRMGDLTWAPLAMALDFSPFDVRTSAYYGEAGVRILASSDRVVRPYAEATAGMARLHSRVSGFGGTADAITNTALRFLDSTQPVFGLGAGVQIQGGPLLVDLGYRYHKVGSGNALQTALTGGRLDVQQVRVGVGVRF